MESHNSVFWVGAIVNIPPLPLVWKSSTPIWIKQWPLEGEELIQAKLFIPQQLEAGHIEPSTSPWNTPIFTIPKKLGKWRLLHDLRAINAIIQPMGTK